jgi:hypothetical protein
VERVDDDRAPAKRINRNGQRTEDMRRRHKQRERALVDNEPEEAHEWTSFRDRKLAKAGSRRTSDLDMEYTQQLWCIVSHQPWLMSCGVEENRKIGAESFFQNPDHKTASA